MALQEVFGHIDAHLDDSLATLSEFCKIPSISAEKRAQPEAAAFVVKLLGEVGVEGLEVPTKGGPHVRSFVEANRGILKADGATIEGGEHTMHGVPKVEFGCKGTLYVELTARTAALDQHSMWARILPTAAWRLITALDTMRDREGRILIPGWTKDAGRPTKEVGSDFRNAEVPEKELLKAWGIKAPLV